MEKREYNQEERNEVLPSVTFDPMACYLYVSPQPESTQAEEGLEGGYGRFILGEAVYADFDPDGRCLGLEIDTRALFHYREEEQVKSKKVRSVKALNQGHSAYQAGRPMERNPYDVTVPEHRDWNIGWLSGMEEE